MTAVRLPGAARNAAFWHENRLQLVCDGLRDHKARPCESIRSVSAAEARRAAKAGGWTVGVKQRNGRPLDYCPEHAPATV